MDDDDYEDENWGNLEGEVITVELEQNNYGLGLSHAGSKVPYLLVFFISQSLSLDVLPLLCVFQFEVTVVTHV